MNTGVEGRVAFPELERTCGSWVVTLANGAVRETFSRTNAKRLHACGFRVETAGQYLGRINQEIRNAAL